MNHTELIAAIAAQGAPWIKAQLQYPELLSADAIAAYNEALLRLEGKPLNFVALWDAMPLKKRRELTKAFAMGFYSCTQ